MSIGKSWEVQPGLGEEILENMGNIVRERKRLGPSIADMTFLAGVYYWSADLLIARRVPEVAERLREPGADPVSLRLIREEYEQHIKAQRMVETIETAKRLEGKKYLDNGGRHWRVRLEPLESGVVEWAETGAAGGGNKKKSRMLEAGEVMEGKSGAIGALDAAPELGGELIIDFPGPERFLPLRRGVHATGLVSPVTGNPQVELDIFAKTELSVIP